MSRSVNPRQGVWSELREPGPVVFASFAYPPNALGYCGPADPATFLGAAAGGTDLAAASALAARFDGAWPYLQLIAACNGITDPLDVRVVDAYWIGNSLLSGVPAATLVSHLDGRFERRARRDFSSMAQAALNGGAAHHSFHVFAVYPWLGLLRAGMDRAPLVVLDQCRIRPGRVLSVDGDSVVVRSRSLVLHGHVLGEGPPRSESVYRSVDGLGFSQELVAGDLVALHWDWVCRRLSSEDCSRLRGWTRRSIEAVNALVAPGPAVACERQGA